MVREGWFRRAPIGRKLRGMILLACAVALGLACTAFVGFELARLRADLEHDLESLADVLGSTSTAALDFDDPAAGREILAALAAQPRVVAATLGRADGTVLASYLSVGAPADAGIAAVPEPGSRTRGWRVTVTRPIALDGRRIGTIALAGEPVGVWGRIFRYLLIAGAVLAAALGAAYALSTVLERIISRPLLHLAATAGEVSEGDDYSIRARRESSDEIGTLVDRFNEMLDQIEQRDRALKEANELLEDRVQERTWDLEEAKIAAEAASRAKSEFLANMSHELRTPLVGVLGFADLLCGTELAAGQRRFVDQIVSSGDALLGIVDDLLDFSRIEADRLEVEAEEIALPELVSSVEQLLAPRAREAGIGLGFEIEEGLPARVETDPARVRQVLIHLVGNAVKFTPSGGVKVRVARAPGSQGLRLRFEVQDTGIGIPPAALPALFDPFTQADGSSAREYGGTGLGLAISQRIVERMGGEIGVESQPGRGSTFWFELPVEAGEGVPVPAAPEAAAGARPAIAGDGVYRVLLVEDNRINRNYIATQIEAMGYRPTAAADGHDALTMLERQRFDLVLMDCQMPGLDGFETVRRLRRRESPGERVPVIAVTAHALAGDRQRCLDAGMDDYLAKPFRPPELRAIIRRWLPATPAADREPDAVA